MIKKLLSTIVGQREADRRAELYRNLIRAEARIGGQLFGPVPPNGRREFFCLDEHTWVWHEEWTDAHGQLQTRTTRYDVRKNAILKAQSGGLYQPVSKEEALRLREAVDIYYNRVRNELYGMVA